MEQDNKNAVTIVLTSSEYYTPFMSVTIQSVLENCKPDVSYKIKILHREISPMNQKMIREMADPMQNVEIKFFQVDRGLLDRKYSMRPGYTAESFLRVFLPFILDAEDKALYLDCDVVVNQDVSLLFKTDLSDYYVAAVKDFDGIGSAYDKGSKRALYMNTVLGLKNVEEYFQSGVMLFNLKKIRESFTPDQLVEASCDPDIKWGDQDVLNRLFKGHVFYLPAVWNVVVNDKMVQQMGSLQRHATRSLNVEYLKSRREPYIIHYAGTQPWNVPLVDMFPFFWRYAYHSPFYPQIVSYAEERIGLKGRLASDSALPNLMVEYIEQGKAGMKYILRFVMAWVKYKISCIKLKNR